jgi:eukaryotic-like serine/threonine-protein kinase
MNDRQCDRLGELLERALELPRDERHAFVERARRDAPALGDELLTLVDAFETSTDRLDHMQQVAGRVFGRVHAANDDVSGTTIGHYRIMALVGGGMGVVYRARDLRLGRNVALKFLPSWLAADAAARERLYAEARAACALDHPNIGVVYEIGEAPQHGLYIALAWYDGQTLKQRLQDGPLPVDDAIHVGAQIAAALQAAHDANVIHRDVKPSNVICTATGVRLLDFGIAKVSGADLTREGVAAGTVAYMSPEQTRAGAVDARTDVWSTGVVLYEMLAGRSPFAGGPDEAVIYRIRNDAPDALSELRPDAPAALIDIVMRCLARVPAERFGTAAELRAQLLAVRAGATTPTASVRRRSGLLRARSMIAAAVVMLALAAVGFLRVNSRGSDANSGSVLAAALRPSLVVLPLENRSASDEDRYFADGLREEITRRLSAVGALHVRSPGAVLQTAAARMAGTGGESQTDALLQGSFHREGARVHVFMELIDARTDALLWSASYDRSVQVADLVALQREIAYSVADALSAELTDAERARVARVPTASTEAYRHYLLGRYHWNRRDEAGMDSAFAHFQEALRLDPMFAAAHAGIADVHVLGYGPAGIGGLPLAVAAARAALEIDPDNAAALASLGGALTLYQWDWPAAGRAFRRSIELDPSYATARQWYAEYLVTQGRIDEAIAEVRIAERLDPLSLIIGWNVARILDMARRQEEAVEQLRALQRLHPQSERVHVLLAGQLLSLGRTDEVADMMDRFVSTGGLPPTKAARLSAVSADMREGRWRTLLEFFEEGGAGNGHGRMFEAAGHTATGNIEGALDIVEEAYRTRTIGLMVPDLVAGAMFDGLRDEPRFQNLLRKMRLDPGIGLRLRRSDRYRAVRDRVLADVVSPSP